MEFCDYDYENYSLGTEYYSCKNLFDDNDFERHKMTPKQEAEYNKELKHYENGKFNSSKMDDFMGENLGNLFLVLFY
jgi:hypothetical protein